MQDLSPVDQFTSPARGVSNGDTPTAEHFNEPTQVLVNRTHYLNNRVGVFCNVGLSGTDIEAGDFLTFGTITGDLADQFDLATATSLRVATAGWYMVHGYVILGQGTSPSTDLAVELMLYGPSSPWPYPTYREDDGSYFVLSFSRAIQIVDPATDFIRLELDVMPVGQISVGVASYLTVQRLA